MVKHLGNNTFFLTLSFGDLKSDELPYAINKLNNLRIRKGVLKNLNFEERCNFLNKNPVLVV